MSKAKKYIILGMVIILLSLFLPIFVNKLPIDETKTVKADLGNADWDETVTPTNPGDGTVSEDDTFTILQIVPYKGLGTLGYLVGGEENIDVTKLSPNLQTAKGNLSTLGNAISLYNSYKEDVLPASGTVNTGWHKGMTVAYQNGYFVWVDWNKGGSYNITGSSYVYAGQGQGDYIAVLNEENTNTSDINNIPTNRKNVVAYFVNGKPSGVELYNSTLRYKPLLVNSNLGHGDYDYDSGTQTFLLDKDHGDYDVIFKQSTDSDATYYIRKEDFQIVNDNTGDYSWSFTYQQVAPKNGIKQGNYNIINVGFVYQSGGPYKWVEDNTVSGTPKITYNNDPYNKYVIRADIRGQEITKSYQFTYGITMINNEWFKRFVLGVSPDQIKNCKVDVITMTPAELNAETNLATINKADFFYISENLQNQDYVDWYRNYTPEGAIDVAYNQNIHNFKVKDLNWDCVEAIFKRIAGVGGFRAAVMISAKSFWDTRTNYSLSYNQYTDMSSIPNGITSDVAATSCNVAKLYLMLMQRDIVDFYNAFMNDYTNSPYKISSVDVDTSINPTGTTGSFVRPDQLPPGFTQTQYKAAQKKNIAVYWNMITFMPYEYKKDTNTLGIIDKSLATEFPNMNILHDPSDLHENVITMDGSEYVNQVFVTKDISNGDVTNPNDYNSAIIYVNSMNNSNQSAFNIAQALNYMTRNGEGYGSDGSGTQIAGDNKDNGEDGSNLRPYVSVLNLEPTADFTSSNAIINSILGNYNIQIDDMTTTQFNSYIKDINTHYDIIYMGSGVGRFNTNSGGTNFNLPDFNTNHYIFLPQGDQITTTLGPKQYYGNDLTQEKTNAIKGFLNAGYTMILDSTLYQKATVVNSNTNVYKLITYIKNNQASYTNVLNQADYDQNNQTIINNFLSKVQKGLDISRPEIALISPVINSGAAYNYFYPDNGNLVIHFKLKAGAKPDSYKYNANLYIDINGDGIFDSTSEKIGIRNSDGTTTTPWEGIQESNEKNYYPKFDMKQEALNLNGIYQLKLQVVRQDNAQIRSEITIYAVYKNVKDIKVLQIIDNPKNGISDYSLANAVSSGNSNSMIREYCGYGNTPLGDYHITFTTKTVSEFEALYTPAHPYQTSNAASTGKLSQYNLMILDNQDDPISNINGAVSNIKDEIADNLAVIFTKGTIDSYTKQQNYLNAGSMLFGDAFTYNLLNLNSSKASELKIYKNLSTNGDLNNTNTYNTTKLTRANKGTITEYPYNIGDTLDITTNSNSSLLAMDFNSDLTIGKPLTGWYSLSDNYSPLVNTTLNQSQMYTGMYSSSPNDVNNNYYLLNRGWVFYSGINLKAADTPTNKKEIQLFVNTIIAAFKNGGRIVKSPPVISIVKPTVTVSDNTIHLTQSDVGDLSFYPIIFEISGSSSKTKLSALWGGNAGTAGDWLHKVYSASEAGNVYGTVDKDHLDSGFYAIFIPVGELKGTHVLKLQADNQDGLSAELNTTIEYNALPITLTIDNSIKNANTGKQYLYVDMDFAVNNEEEYYQDHSNDIRLEFSLAQMGTKKASVTLKDLDNAVVNVVDSKIYDALDSSKSYDIGVTELPEGSYYIDIPASVMSGISSKDIMITAGTDSSNTTSQTVTLLRRSLFQLD